MANTNIKFTPDDGKVIYCTTLTYARTIAGEANKCMILLGGTTVGDGTYGAFYWNATSTSADDNGSTTIVPNGVTTGTWTKFAI